MPRLRRLNLTGTGITTLPESFYSLTELDHVQIAFADLDNPTRQRLTALTRTEPDNPTHDWIRAIQIRLLLKVGRATDAYTAANRILSRRPDFTDLNDITAATEFQAWRRTT